MDVRAILFDLDGTLLDTLDDIADAANAVLEAGGFPTHPTADFRRFIGEGVAVLFRRALPQGAADAEPELVARCVARFQVEYGERWHVKSRPYDGIPELLDALTARGLTLGLLSNKPDDFTRRYGEHYLARWPFRVVLGAREGVPRKPDPTSALEVAARLGLPPAAIVYVGDSAVDVETAVRSGMIPVGVSWGFRPVEELRAAGARMILDRPHDLLGWLERHGGTPG
ncbi:MAG: HAD family hydrolase [Isosphaeraceae bacterium]